MLRKLTKEKNRYVLIRIPIQIANSLGWGDYIKIEVNQDEKYIIVKGVKL